MPDKVADGRRRDMGKFLRGRYYDGFEVGCEQAVGIGYRPFVLEVEHIAHAPDYMLDTQRVAEIDGETVVIDYRYPIELFYGLKNDVAALLVVKKPALVLIDTDGDYDFVKDGVLR